MSKKKIIAIIEARMTSTRLPGKVLKPLAGKPALQQMIERIKQSKKIDDLVVATTTNNTDQAIVDLCEKIDCHYFRGSEHDVMSRVLMAAEKYQATHIVGLTGDCPLIDSGLIDSMIQQFFSADYDYISNRIEPGLPDGFDVQVYTVQALKKASTSTSDPIDRVHVTCYLYQNPKIFKIGSFPPKIQDEMYWPDLAVTLDEEADYQLLQEIFSSLSKLNDFFSATEVLKFLKKNPQLLEINQLVKRKQIHEG